MRPRPSYQMPRNSICAGICDVLLQMRLLLPVLLLCAALAPAQVKFSSEPNRIRIQIDGKPYGDFIFKSEDAMKPYVWPLRAASGAMVTRNWPMETVATVEPKDHQHQRGLWFGPD